MSFADEDQLWSLLPSVHRTRDAELGGQLHGPLHALLRLIAREVGTLERDLDQLYDDWFIETCADWAIPWIGEIVGYRTPPLCSPAAAWPEPLPSPRREVANTLRVRRRKGTFALLAALGRDVADWPARPVELHRLVATTQHLSRGRPRRHGLLDLRDSGSLERLGSPFERTPRTLSVGRVNSSRTPGRPNLNGVALFVWRLPAFSVTRFPAFRLDETPERFLVNSLGIDTPLVKRPEPHPAPGVLDELDAPGVIGRRAFAESSSAFYGPGRSLTIWRRYGQTLREVPLHDIVAADLGSWQVRARGHEVLVDPERGRLALHPRRLPDEVLVTYHYAFPAALGGGEYPRPLQPPDARPVYRVGAQEPHPRLADALDAWRQDRGTDPTNPDRTKQRALIEMAAGLYEDTIPTIALTDGDDLEIRAAREARVELRLLNQRAGRLDALIIEAPRQRDRSHAEGHEGQPGLIPPRPPRLTLDGLLVSGRGVHVTGAFSEVSLRHSTLVPGWSLERGDERGRGDEVSLVLDDATTRLSVTECIVGSMVVQSGGWHDEDDDTEQPDDRRDRAGQHRRSARQGRGNEPVALLVADSILDAPGTESPALAGIAGSAANATLTIRRSTVLGSIAVRRLDLAEDAIFTGPVQVTHRQEGCVRFSYLPGDSRTPHRYHCQPELALAAAGEQAGRWQADAWERDDLEHREQLRVRPKFASRRYGSPDYVRLAPGCPSEIRRGGEHGLEPGVYRNRFEPYREAVLAARLAEYVPAGMDAAVLDASPTATAGGGR